MWKIIAFIILVASLLIVIWFREGLILGTAEDGLIFYNLSNYYHQSEYTWMEYPGLGSPSLNLTAGKPTYYLLSSAQALGIPGFIIQGVVMWFLLISAALGVYLIVKELFPKLPLKYILLSILFYWFNPISLVDVWNRFLLNYIFFFALLPICSFFYIKGLRSRKYYFILALNICLIIYSYAFSYIAFTILFFIWLFLITFFYFLLNKNWQIRIFALKYLFLTLLVFSIANSWWVLPSLKLYFSGGSSPTANLFLKQNSPEILKALSKSLGSLTGIFKLINTSFLSSDSLGWVKLYYSPLLYIIQYFFVGIILLFIIKFRKDLIVLFLGSLFLTIVFLSKGINPPFGEIYGLIFKKVLILQVFRNPFEKFGFLLSLVASLLLGPSIYEWIKDTLNKFEKFIYQAFLFSILLFLGLPFFTGLILTNKFPPTDNYSIGYKVKVPEYYTKVNYWLVNRGNNFRYIGFPIKDEGVTYNWEKGYAGVELPVALFSNSGLLHTTSVPFFNQIIPQIEQSLMSDKDFFNLANLVNAKYYMLRYDIDYKLRAMTAPAVIEKKLKEREQKGEVENVATFGKVSIWENKKWKDRTFYIAEKIINVKNFDDIQDLTKVNVSDGDILIDQDGFNKTQNFFDWGLIDSIPDITYEKINTTKYILHIKNTTKPFLLFFSELYNDGWQAFTSDGQLINNHIRINLFGNGWLIERKGDFDVVVEFAPQKWMNIGEKISLNAFFVIVAMLIFSQLSLKGKSV